MNEEFADDENLTYLDFDMIKTCNFGLLGLVRDLTSFSLRGPIRSRTK